MAKKAQGSKRLSKNDKTSGALKSAKKTRSGMSSRGSRSRLSQVPLLDMLAEVASATLQNDPSLNSRNRSMKKSVSKRGSAAEARNRSSSSSTSPNRKLASQAELLNLDQIRVLSDKMLLEMFAEMTSDEIRRQYAYKCYLVPEKCSETFKSFGSETRARLQMKSHLLTHIAELLAEANVSTRSQKVKFMAEPIQTRMKRFQDNLLKRKRHSTSSLPVTTTPVKKMSKGKDQSSESVKKKLADDKKTHLAGRNNKNSRPGSKDSDKNTAKKKNSEYILPIDIKTEPSTEESEPDTDETDSDDEDNVSEEDNNQSINLNDLVDPRNFVIIAPQEEIEERQEEVIKDVIDTLEQPGHDHKYTSVLGKKRGIETVHFEYVITSDEEAETASRDADSRSYSRGIMYENPQLIVATPSFPFVYVPLLPNIAQIVEIKEHKSPQKRASFDSKGMLIWDTGSISLSTEKPMQKKKQTRIRKIHKVIVPEELEPDSDEGNELHEIIQQPIRVYRNTLEELEQQRALATIDQLDNETPGMYAATEETCSIVNINGYHQIGPPITSETIEITTLAPPLTKFMPPNGVEESERKLALKYIRLLRTRRKEERGALVCKICQNRTFTAQATLMYHYRSHAGIKPFICSICGSTFTRQHSLNYHMLIHNNKSRFVCEDCGRNFRHPSHYKEHLRRHTGETPYECADCGLRFKTRNTYKRHLKTRHGKILTAQGIVTLSLEEFYKVRTNPRRKSTGNTPPKQLPIILTNSKKDQETQWPESMATCLQPEDIQEMEEIQEMHEIEVRQYLESPPEAVAFQVINGLSDD